MSWAAEYEKLCYFNIVIGFQRGLCVERNETGGHFEVGCMCFQLK